MAEFSLHLLPQCAVDNRHAVTTGGQCAARGVREIYAVAVDGDALAVTQREFLRDTGAKEDRDGIGRLGSVADAHRGAVFADNLDFRSARSALHFSFLIGHFLCFLKH